MARANSPVKAGAPPCVRCPVLPVPASSAAVTAVLAVTALSAAFAVKHLVADFLMQTNAMARGKERPAGWLGPLLAHVLLPRSR